MRYPRLCSSQALGILYQRNIIWRCSVLKAIPEPRPTKLGQPRPNLATPISPARAGIRL